LTGQLRWCFRGGSDAHRRFHRTTAHGASIAGGIWGNAAGHVQSRLTAHPYLWRPLRAAGDIPPDDRRRCIEQKSLPHFVYAQLGLNSCRACLVEIRQILYE
jgi:hypothetical protein